MWGLCCCRMSLPGMSETNIDARAHQKLRCSRARRPAGESLEAQLSHKLAEYAENRSITSVVPVCDPLTTDEPELLEMSPEQAEATQLCAPLLLTTAVAASGA